jgi:hypothetical protein
MKRRMIISSVILVDDKNFRRIYEEGQHAGMAYGDAGPERVVTRMLQNYGIDGCFPGVDSVGLVFSLQDPRVVRSDSLDGPAEGL